jgi:predicted RNase H-like nuclease (RuvC/YqgF family)
MNLQKILGDYNRILTYLEAEIAEIDKDLQSSAARQRELEARRAEVIGGIFGLKKEIESKERI